MKTNCIFRLIEHCLRGNEDLAIKYAERIYDLMEKDEYDLPKKDFSDLCRAYFHPELGHWVVQDKST